MLDRHGYRSALRHPTALQVLVELVDALAAGSDTSAGRVAVELDDAHPLVGELARLVSDLTSDLPPDSAGARFLDAALQGLRDVLPRRDAHGRIRVDPGSCGGYLS